MRTTFADVDEDEDEIDSGDSGAEEGFEMDERSAAKEEEGPSAADIDGKRRLASMFGLVSNGRSV